jgi:acetoacetate decarboxylase
MSDSNATLIQADQLELLVQGRLFGQCRVSDLRVLIQNEGVVLQGQTTTYYAKQLVQHAVMDVTNLPILANEIEVCSDARPRQKPH